MGTTAIYVGERPRPKEIVELLVKNLSSPSCQVIDRSGLREFSHMFLLMESKIQPEDKPVKTSRFIVHVKAEYIENSIFYRETDEAAGISRLDCPNRLVKGAQLCEPINETSAKWRQDVIAYNARRSEEEKIIRKLDKLQLNDREGRRIVLNSGEVVEYEKGRRWTKRLRAYRWEGRLHQLKPGQMDVEATKRLQQQAATANQAAMQAA